MQASGKSLGAGAYIVNIMYTAFLLVVLFERVVAVKFPDGRQEKSRVGPLQMICFTRTFQM